MLSVISVFDQVIEAILSLPSSLIVFLFLHLLFVLVNEWEGERQEILRVAVEVLMII